MPLPRPPIKVFVRRLNGSETTYAAVEAACLFPAIFAKIADAAGKNLTAASSTKAAISLRTSPFPVPAD